MANGLFWDKEDLIREIPKGRGDLYRISLCERNGRKYVSLREWYLSRDDELRPGRAGVVLSIDLAEEIGTVIATTATGSLPTTGD